MVETNSEIKHTLIMSTKKERSIIYWCIFHACSSSYNLL